MGGRKARPGERRAAFERFDSQEYPTVPDEELIDDRENARQQQREQHDNDPKQRHLPSPASRAPSVALSRGEIAKVRTRF